MKPALLWLALLSTPAAEEVKVSSASAILFESVEMADRCAAALKREADVHATTKGYQSEYDRLQVERDPGKPQASMTPAERDAWKARKAAAEKALAELDAKFPQYRDGDQILLIDAKASAERERVCSEAATARLTEGTVLTVLKREQLLRVRVETGRSAGKVGFVLASDVKAGPTAP